MRGMYAYAGRYQKRGGLVGVWLGDDILVHVVISLSPLGFFLLWVLSSWGIFSCIFLLSNFVIRPSPFPYWCGVLSMIVFDGVIDCCNRVFLSFSLSVSPFSWKCHVFIPVF